jgi:hypothetical protein
MPVALGLLNTYLHKKIRSSFLFFQVNNLTNQVQLLHLKMRSYYIMRLFQAFTFVLSMYLSHIKAFSFRARDICTPSHVQCTSHWKHTKLTSELHRSQGYTKKISMVRLMRDVEVSIHSIMVK